MSILLKQLLNEIENPQEQNPLKVQVYVDMDGVLVDMVGGFKELSGGLDLNQYAEKVDPLTGKKNGRGGCWKLINKKPTFWKDLKPMPDAKVLWDFISDNFKQPVPVVLSAGQGQPILNQKTEWIRKHISSTVKVILANSGKEKVNYIIDQPYTTHILVDDTQANIDGWDDIDKHRIGIFHRDAASTIKQLRNYIMEKK